MNDINKPENHKKLKISLDFHRSYTDLPNQCKVCFHIPKSSATFVFHEKHIARKVLTVLQLQTLLSEGQKKDCGTEDKEKNNKEEGE